jgi:hypothetical protein
MQVPLNPEIATFPTGLYLCSSSSNSSSSSSSSKNERVATALPTLHTARIPIPARLGDCPELWKESAKNRQTLYWSADGPLHDSQATMAEQYVMEEYWVYNISDFTLCGEIPSFALTTGVYNTLYLL